MCDHSGLNCVTILEGSKMRRPVTLYVWVCNFVTRAEEGECVNQGRGAGEKGCTNFLNISSNLKILDARNVT